MSIAIGLTIAFLILYIGYGTFVSEYKKELRTILSIVAMVSIAMVWMIFVLMFVGEYNRLETFFYIIFIMISAYSLYRTYLLSKTKPLKIVAKQENYWGIEQEDIYNKHNWKLEFMSDRIEVKSDPLSKQIYRKYSNNEEFISGNIFLTIRDLKLTKVKNLKEIKSKLYITILNKFKEIVKELELKDEFDNLLKENDYIVEFFLINCWEIYTQRVNLGIATLEVLATNLTEYELLGAFDNATLNSVKRHGAAIYFEYMKFKNLLPIEDIKAKQDYKSKDL